MIESPRPWLPPSLVRHHFTPDSVVELSYLFIDEIVDSTVTFLAHRWPFADRLGRVNFGARDEQIEFSISLTAAQRLLYRSFRRRQPRPGDAFAARVRPDAVQRLQDEGGLVDLSEVVDGMVFNLSAEARLVAKLAYHGSLTAVFSDDKAKEWGLPPAELEPIRPAPAQMMGERP